MQRPCAIITFLLPVPSTNNDEIPTAEEAKRFAEIRLEHLINRNREDIELQQAFGYTVETDMVEFTTLRLVDDE